MTIEIPAASGISSSERIALIERIAGSAGLRRSQRLREFLLYVGREAVERGVLELHEQQIGERVFGRRAAYDTNADNIVRVTATELRKRMEGYFSTEGADEAWIAEIPRGSYLPVFRPRPQEHAVSAPVSHPPGEVKQKKAEERSELAVSAGRHHLWMWQALCGLLVLVLASLAWREVQLKRALQPWKQGPVLRAFWAPFLERGSSTDLLLADTSFALAEDIAGHEVPLSDYLNASYRGLGQANGLDASQQADLKLIMDRNNGSFGDFQVAQQILRLDPTSAVLRMQFARDYTADSIQRNNAILIGSRKSNPWVDLFEGRLNFVLRYSAATHASYVEDRHPLAGEQARYLADADSNMGDGYSVIAVLPGVAAQRRVLILEGTGSQATNSAGDFVTTEAALEMLQKRFGGQLPQAFEVLLRTAHLRGTPLESSIVAVRVH